MKRPQSYRYDPLDPAPTQIDVDRYPIEDVPIDQTAVEARADVLTYTSEPLTQELAISGLAACLSCSRRAIATTPNGT